MLVPFIGYASDRRFIGYVECEAEKLPEGLGRRRSIEIHDAFVESFDDDTVTNLGDGEVDRSILYAIELGGDRGDAAGRRGARQRLQIQLGPYSALGQLHGQPVVAPSTTLLSNGPMVQLADATLAFVNRGQLVMRDVGMLIVNRDLIDWVRASEDEALAFPGVTVLTDRA